MTGLPTSDRFVSPNIFLTISELGKIWNKKRPRIEPNIERAWDTLIDIWAESSDLPLILRKSSGIRGKEYQHSSGRSIVVSDNSPAQWVCYRALKGDVPTTDNIREYLADDKIPMSYAIKKSDKVHVDYKRTLGEFSLNKLGWKLCHISPVGIKSRKKIDELNINEVVSKFKNLLKPSNFFLVPKLLGGLGEVEEFVREMH